MKFYLRSGDLQDNPQLLDQYKIAGVFGDEIDTTDILVYSIRNMDILHERTKIGKRIVIDSPEAMDEALDDNEIEASIILLETSDWHIIPIENLIAKYASKDTELVATASTPEEITLLANILELGINGCLLDPTGNFTLDELLSTISTDQYEVDLVELEVSSTEKIGNGDRVCVDTVSILRQGEGMLVGSASAVQALVQAEVEESGFVNSRPFRVNAGVVASYTLNFDKTNYLSELAAGSTVMIVDEEGKSRKEFVARVKIERRPLILVKLKYKDREFPVILQDAETVKLVTPNGSIRVDQLQPGDTILCHISPKARHFGMEIDEFIEER